MTIFILEKGPNNLRGLLKKWLIEPKANIFVGKISKTLRDKLWDIIQDARIDGALCIYTCNNEQGFDFYKYGDSCLKVVDFDSIKLIASRA